MKKAGKGILGYIILAIIFVVLTVIAFAAPFLKNTGTFWIAYLFGVIAIAFQIHVFKIAFADEGDNKSKFYGLPIIKVGLIYLVAQFIVSIIEMSLAKYLPFWISLIVNVIFFAIAAIGSIVGKVMKEEIHGQDIVVERDTTNMRLLQKSAAELSALCVDSESKTIAKKVAEEIRYSDPVSNEKTVELEEKLISFVEDYKAVIKKGNLEEIKESGELILSLLSERNKVCSLNKK